MENTNTVYDILVIGGGPGGLSAALYAGRSEMKTLLLEEALLGGQIATTHFVENYPGSIENPSGPKLIERMEQQVQHFGVEIVYDQAQKIEKNDDIFSVYGMSKKVYQAKTLIVGLGASPRTLGIPGEDEFRGMGVSYCATCDGAFFKNKAVAAIGGGDTALQESAFLTKFASKVYLIHRRDEFRGAKSLVSRTKKNPRIEIMLDTIPLRVVGSSTVEGLEVQNKVTGETKILEDVEGVFMFVGNNPNTALIKDFVDVDAQGYVLANADMSTKTPGLFAIGDMIQKPLRQAVTAASDGAIAAISAEHYIAEME